MSNRDIFAERERGLEEEYFMRKERELIEKLRHKHAGETARQQMAAATGVHDEEALEALQELGYTPATVQLLHLVPLVQVAWSSGGVSDDERALILEAARQRGVAAGSEAEAQLNNWLTQQPPQAFFDNTLRAIRIFIAALPNDQREDAGHDLLAYCTRIAEASGGFLGFGTIAEGERQALQQIAEALTQNREEAVKQVIAE